MSKILIQQE